ncbi:MAG: ABC transporter ATP-binding protein [Planctomycetota bacterium]
MPAIVAENISKTFRLGRVDVPVLRGASVEVAEGEWLAILGSSGSGKSTLLHLMGGLDRPDRGSGSITYFDDRPLDRMPVRTLDAFRNKTVGFVFQFYHLLPELSVVENVLLGAMIGRGRLGYAAARRSMVERAEGLLDGLGLADRRRARPITLSGGERQRVAVARALINDPPVILADEPTGNLDRANGDSLLESFSALHGDGRTLIMVTHDDAVAARADRVVSMYDGRLSAGSGR